MINIIIAIIVFGIIVLVHEFGHYIVAKKNGILVEEFAIGMGPKLISTKKGDTVYSIRVLPLGGFCKMLGEEEESNDERAFGEKSVPSRMAVIAAGPFMNFLLAFVILLIFAGSFGYRGTSISTIESGYPAESAGLKVGDKITKINNKNIHIFYDITYILAENQGKEINITVKRNNEKLKFNIKPKWDEEYKTWMIGFSPKNEKGNVFGMLNNSFWEMIFYVKMTIVGFVKLITGQVSRNQIAGPIGIVKIIGESYQAGLKTSILAAIVNVAHLMVLLSANLGALNLFPIPALDGSRLVFLGIEAIRKKPINANIENTVHLIGFALLMLLMVFVAYNDITRLFS